MTFGSVAAAGCLMMFIRYKYGNPKLDTDFQEDTSDDKS